MTFLGGNTSTQQPSEMYCFSSCKPLGEHGEAIYHNPRSSFPIKHATSSLIVLFLQKVKATSISNCCWIKPVPLFHVSWETSGKSHYILMMSFLVCEEPESIGVNQICSTSCRNFSRRWPAQASSFSLFATLRSPYL